MTRCLVALALLLAAPEPAPRYAFGYATEFRTCLWCGRHLRAGHAYFDTDRCGRMFAEQLAVRGLRVHGEEIVAVE